VGGPGSMWWDSTLPVHWWHGYSCYFAICGNSYIQASLKVLEADY